MKRILWGLYCIATGLFCGWASWLVAHGPMDVLQFFAVLFFAYIGAFVAAMGVAHMRGLP